MQVLVYTRPCFSTCLPLYASAVVHAHNHALWHRAMATAWQIYLGVCMHAWSAVSEVKGYRRGLTNMPAAAAAAAAGIWFCVLQRHPEPNTTCPVLVSETACSLLLGPGWEAGRKPGRGWMGDWVGGLAAKHRSLFLSKSVVSKTLTINAQLQKPVYFIIKACCFAPMSTSRCSR